MGLYSISNRLYQIMKKLFTLIALCFCVNAFGVNYFPNGLFTPVSSQVVCYNSMNTVMTATYTVCANTTAGTLMLTPQWYFNGALVYTGAAFASTAGGGTTTLPANTITYSTPGTFSGANGLYCTLTWTPASPAACGTLTTISSSPVSVLVTTAPGVIVGLNTVCTGSTINLSNPAPGGTWTSSNSSVATIGPNTGTVSGVVAGPATMTYANGCGPNAQQTVMVIASPAPIGGPTFVCVGSAVSLSQSVTSGTWFSSNPGVASVAQFAGTLYGISEGSADITYSTGCGTASVYPVTSRISPAGITGAKAVCAGSATTLGNTTLFGTWTSSNSTVATVGQSSGLVTGVSAGVTNITYANGCGFNALYSFSVDVTPVTPPAIIGSHTVCIGNVTPLSNALGGGTWTSNNIAIAFVNSVGAVTGAALGDARITYSNTNACGTALTTHTVTVINLAAPAPIIGPSTVCGGATVRLSTAVYGGTWASSSTSVATVDTVGIVSGVTTGTTVITYTMFNACSSAFKTFTLSVIGTVPTAPAAITGAASMCAGSTRTLSNATAGGVWISTNPGAATISSSGVLTAVAAGTTVISYSIINSCGTAAKTATVTVSIPPNAGSILGPGTVCLNDTIQLTSTSFGGVWTSSDSFTVKPIANTGKMRGLAFGAATITYTVGNACGIAFTTYPVSVVDFGACAHPSAVGQVAGADDLKVYPNPNTGTFTISGLVGAADKAATIEVADIMGKVVYRNTAATQSGVLHHNVAVSNLANGVYLVTIRAGALVRTLRMTVGQQ